MTILSTDLSLRKIEAKIIEGEKLDEAEEEYIRKKIEDFWDNHPDVVNRFPRWKKYMAWIAGYQFYDYNKYSKRLVEVPIKRKRKIIFNKLRTFVRTLLAKLAADVPSMSVIPNTREDEDMEAARVGDKVIEGLSKKIRFNDSLNNLKLWTIIANRGYLRVFWNKDDYGVVDSEPETGEEIREDGDVCIESVSPFNCRPDSLYFDRKRWRWFVYGEEVDAIELEEEYELEEGTLAEQSDVLENAYDLEMFDEHELIMGESGTEEDVTGRTVVLKELWTPRVYIFTAGTSVLEYGVNPYGEIPFYPTEDRVVPIGNYSKGFMYNDSLLKDAIPVQREYNRQISLMSTALAVASKLKILTPLGSMVSKKHFTNDYGVFMDYNPRQGVPPFQMKLDPLPAFAQVYKQEVEREFETAFNVHEASFGRLPERASHASGTLVNLLLEQDDTVLNPMLAMINNTVREAWSLALRMVKDNYVTGRLIKIVGEDGEDSVMKFVGSDLRGNTDVQVITQAGLPRSRALRTEFLIKLRAEAGIQLEDKTILELMEFGQVDKVFEDNLLHERRAYRENDVIEDTPDITEQDVKGWVHPLEDKGAHLKIHSRLIFGRKFEKLSQNQQKAMNAHAMETYQIHMQEQMAMMQSQEEAPPEGQAQG